MNIVLVTCVQQVSCHEDAGNPNVPEQMRHMLKSKAFHDVYQLAKDFLYS